MDGQAHSLLHPFELDLGTTTLSVDTTPTGVLMDYDGLQIELTVVKPSASFCIFYSSYRVLTSFVETYAPLIGLLGTPNGNQADDFLNADGSPYDGTPNNAYCATSWCIPSLEQCLFMHTSALSFDYINKCNETDPQTLQNQVANAPTAWKDFCGGNEACLIDMIAMEGDTEMASQNLAFVDTIDREVSEIATPPCQDSSSCPNGRTCGLREYSQESDKVCCPLESSYLTTICDECEQVEVCAQQPAGNACFRK